MELREEVGVKESHKEAGEELAKVGWTCRNNGRVGAIDEDSGCAWSGWQKKEKTEAEMEGLREERYSGNGRGMENECRRVQTIGGDGSKTGLVMKKIGNINRRPVSVPASGKGGEQQPAIEAHSYHP